MTRPSNECRAKVQKYIRHHFPSMKDVKPRVSSRKYSGQLRHRFTFRKSLQPAGGGSFPQVLHVTADEQGNVIKVSVSR
jgi:hypothetical protein